MNNITVICSDNKLKIIFSEYKIVDDGVEIELVPEEVDALIEYIEMSEDIDNGF